MSFKTLLTLYSVIFLRCFYVVGWPSSLDFCPSVLQSGGPPQIEGCGNCGLSQADGRGGRHMLRLIGSRSYIRLKGGSITSNAVTRRFRHFLSYFRVFSTRSRSYNVIMGGFRTGDSGVMSQADGRGGQASLRPRRGCFCESERHPV